jgi:HAD superfamily hydrolase (TIGR01549 family)
MPRNGAPAHLNGREIDAVLVDAGGVLLHPNWEVVAELLGRQGVTASAEELGAAEPLAMRELDEAEVIRATTDIARRERLLARVLRHAGIPAEADAIDAATDEMEAIHQSRGIWEIVYDGAADALDALRAAGLRLSLASNAEPMLRRKLEELGLAQRFDHLAISGEMGVEKPEPRFFTEALDALGVPAERAVHIGDLYEIDVYGARSAGLEAILVDVADLSADRDVSRVRSLAEVPSLIGLT